MALTKFPFWECRTALVTETYRQQLTAPASMAEFSGSERAWLLHDQQDMGLVLSRWLRLVEIFSKCDLTIADDKLVAFSGLAKSFSAYFQEFYYAGVWGGEFLVPCLLWTTYASDANNTSPTLSTYRGALPF